MKTALLTIIVCLWSFGLRAQNTDLPGPTANLQTLPAGSYVIAMDNTLQVNTAGDFNLKAYGLIVYLLNNDVKIKWAITAGKAKDGIDFTASAEQLKPILISGGISRNFKAGPFVIPAADTTGVGDLITAFYTANALTGFNRPQVYRLTSAAANVDIRYDLWGFKPKGAVLTDGGNQNIHLAYMTAAGIPAANYTTSTGSNLETECFTFASEPHNSNTGTAVNNAITAIRNFVTKGGNFLAQCEAISNYENNTLGRFQTSGGITVTNTNIGTTLTYSNPDLGFSQFEGDYNASSGGSIKNWKVIGSLTNNEHDHATGTGTNAGVIGASVSKHYYGKGGLVFYIGNHSFATSSLTGINGIRMYMNAFLTPTNSNCPVFTYVALPVKLIHFAGSAKNGYINLQWTLANNEDAGEFEIQKSFDGVHFQDLKSMKPNNSYGTADYTFLTSADLTRTYYRLRMINRLKEVQYSTVLSFAEMPANTSALTVLNGSGRGDLVLIYSSPTSGAIDLSLYNTAGSKIYQVKMMAVEGANMISIPASFVRVQGIYVAVVADHSGTLQSAKFSRTE